MLDHSKLKSQNAKNEARRKNLAASKVRDKIQEMIRQILFK